MAINGVTYGRCDSSISESGNASILGVRKHVDVLTRLPLTEQ